jgi:hypothetical protein
MSPEEKKRVIEKLRAGIINFVGIPNAPFDPAKQPFLDALHEISADKPNTKPLRYLLQETKLQLETRCLISSNEKISLEKYIEHQKAIGEWVSLIQKGKTFSVKPHRIFSLSYGDRTRFKNLMSAIDDATEILNNIDGISIKLKTEAPRIDSAKKKSQEHVPIAKSQRYTPSPSGSDSTVSSNSNLDRGLKRMHSMMDLHSDPAKNSDIHENRPKSAPTVLKTI